MAFIQGLPGLQAKILIEIVGPTDNLHLTCLWDIWETNRMGTLVLSNLLRLKCANMYWRGLMLTGVCSINNIEVYLCGCLLFRCLSISIYLSIYLFVYSIYLPLSINLSIYPTYPAFLSLPTCPTDHLSYPFPILSSSLSIQSILSCLQNLVYPIYNIYPIYHFYLIYPIYPIYPMCSIYSILSILFILPT